MARYKRNRPKNRRAGCLMRKPHKMNGAKKTKGNLGNIGHRMKLTAC